MYSTARTLRKNLIRLPVHHPGTMPVRLRPTTEEDLDFVLSTEHSAENRPFVTTWTREQHLATLSSNDISHLIIESVQDRHRVGYVIVAGRGNQNRSIELRRVVVTEKGKGYGRNVVRLVKQLAFDELKAHRLWLDVKEHNARARRLYESEGFEVEGVLRECLKTEAGFESLVVMSVLRDDKRDCMT